jgi:hypothetical protein
VRVLRRDPTVRWRAWLEVSQQAKTRSVFISDGVRVEGCHEITPVPKFDSASNLICSPLLFGFRLVMAARMLVVENNI